MCIRDRGYSHEPGDLAKKANAWILARDGLIATSFPSGHVGNGVDGPILRWALSRAKGREPVVWVTDGQVTDSNDHPNDALSIESVSYTHLDVYKRQLLNQLGTLFH